MERFEEYMAEPTAPLGIALDDSPEFLDSDFQESDDSRSISEDRGAESISTDDPVRVYLREMGSVSLLKRQGEIDLAKRMERGKTRMQKALSRSPLVWQSALALDNDVADGKLRLDDFIDIEGKDEAAREKARRQVTWQLAELARLKNNLLDLEQRIAATPDRHVNVRAKLMSAALRLRVGCSQQIRRIPFTQEQWNTFRAVLKHAVEGIGRLEGELNYRRNSRASIRELEGQIRELEASAGASATPMRNFRKTDQQGFGELHNAKYTPL
jgi:RNA polymerase primary sigma factor